MWSGGGRSFFYDRISISKVWTCMENIVSVRPQKLFVVLRLCTDKIEYSLHVQCIYTNLRMFDIEQRKRGSLGGRSRIRSNAYTHVENSEAETRSWNPLVCFCN